MSKGRYIYRIYVYFSATGYNAIASQYLPLQDKILCWDGRNIGLRAPYNGILLLDTILQTPVAHREDVVRIEVPLNEAMILLYSLQNLEESASSLKNTGDLQNELLARIDEAHNAIALAAAVIGEKADQPPEGVKAQKWRTVCLELPQSYFKEIAAFIVQELKRLDRHIPALTIASSISERLTELLVGARLQDVVGVGQQQRQLMYAESTRRQTFAHWPHMDYKWALPKQMAQAGFYHQPSNTGDDRAMCFTCNVCLVCWEKTDEPWSEHERHSPTCPFVRGEYTQNVPLSVSFATNAAAVVNPNGIAGGCYDMVSAGSETDMVCTANVDSGVVTLWGVKHALRRRGQFCVHDERTRIAEHIGDEAMRLHAISTYRSCEPGAGRSRANCKGFRMACAVTAGDKQFLFVYGAKQMDETRDTMTSPTLMTLSSLLIDGTGVTETYMKSLNPVKALPGESKLTLSVGGGEIFGDESVADHDHPAILEDEDNVTPVNAETQTTLKNVALSFEEPWLQMQEGLDNQLKEAFFPRSEHLDGASTSSGRYSGNIDERTANDDDVQAQFLSCVQIQPLIDGRHDITDLILSYDNKFLLVS